MSKAISAAYYISSGVRRAAAAREAGWRDIPATIYRLGHLPVTTRVPLDQLHSSKFEVDRDSRYIRNTEYPTAFLGTEPPPIELEPLGSPGQMRSIP
jgi:hypothetical protein